MQDASIIDSKSLSTADHNIQRLGMLRDLTKDQRLLAEFMSDLSEEAYSAGWMTDLEYSLWEAVLGVRRQYGRLELTEAHGMRLRELSDGCGGWIVFDDDTEQTWLPRAEWEERFSARSGAGGKFE